MAEGNANRTKILVVGVGGQGVLTAAGLLGHAAASTGQNVTIGQLHGMSQRGGSVEGSVLIGPGKSAFVGPGSADILLGLEPLEALRALPKLSPATKVVINTGQIMPQILVREGRPYPELGEILDQVRQVTPEVRTVDGPGIVKEVGEDRTIGTVMLGALAGFGWLPVEEEALRSILDTRVPPHYREANHRAFSLGKGAAAKIEDR